MLDSFDVNDEALLADGDGSEEGRDAAEAAAREDDKWMPGFEGVYYKDGTLAKKIGGEYLPLLSLRPQR